MAITNGVLNSIRFIVRERLVEKSNICASEEQVNYIFCIYTPSVESVSTLHGIKAQTTCRKPKLHMISAPFVCVHYTFH